MKFKIWQNIAQAFEKLHISYRFLLFVPGILLIGKILLETEIDKIT